MNEVRRDFDVSIIIVSWNAAQCIGDCLRSIPAALGALRGEIFVIDNNSSDQTVSRVNGLKNNLSNLHLIELKDNIGFSRANNRAAKEAKGKYLLLLNPDTELTHHAIATLVSCSSTHEAALVGAKHCNPDRSLQPSVRRLPSISAMIFLLLKLHRIFPRASLWRHYLASDFDYSQAQAAEQLAGSCLLVRRDAWDMLNGFDERFHLWFEDVDLCYRAKAAKLKTWYCPDSTVVHLGGQGFRQLSTIRRQRAFNRSLRYYIRKHHGALFWLLLWAVEPLSLTLAALTEYLPRGMDKNERQV
ncbi:MAG: glycosyltransferase family 2 protein [Patescibacteria group bacterium]|nr:glycosyltransferase family 2 protein [Patescibacteria group bacterium]